MQEKKSPKRPIFLYYIIVLVILMLMNALVFPSLLEAQINKVDYGTFLTQVKDGKVSKVEIGNDKITYIAKETLR